MDNKFGLTNDINEHLAAVAFREAAISDGWIAAALYDNEPMESYAHLTKDGYAMHVNARVGNSGCYKYQAQVSIWGSDGLAIKAPKIYDHDAIFKEGMNRCVNCGAIGETFRYGFAGRCCRICLTEMRKKYEFPGWRD